MEASDLVGKTATIVDVDLDTEGPGLVPHITLEVDGDTVTLEAELHQTRGQAVLAIR